MQAYKKYILCLITLFVLFMTACSPETSYKILSFVFDGVPDPNLAQNTDSTNSVRPDSTEILLIADKAKPQIYFHPPYKDKDCSSCHNNNMGQVSVRQPDLCYVCHENFENQYTNVHGPVAGGYCTSCHNPHKSKLPNLLVNSGSDLCFKCHDSQIIENDIHAVAETSDCLSCHNPHGENNSVLTKNGTCYKCHENFSDKYKYLHGPVAGGFCYSCHDTHSSKSDYKLLLTGQNLCYKCHNKKSVLKNENHEGIDDINCIECHNPHGGDDKYLFN